MRISNSVDSPPNDGTVTTANVNDVVVVNADNFEAFPEREAMEHLRGADMEDRMYICIAQDGAYPQTNAIKNILDPWCVSKNKYVCFIKYAAACSMTQSPNDVSSCHSLLHRAYKSEDFRSSQEKSITVPDTKVWMDVKEKFMKVLDKPSFTMCWRLMAKALVYLPKAFADAHILNAFKRIGMVPLDIHRVLSTSTRYGELSLAAGADVANKVPKFADILMKECFIADHCYEEMLGKEFLESVDDIGNSRVGKRPLEQLSTSRQRAGFFGKLITGTPFKSLATSAICASNDPSSGGGGGVAAAADASSAASVSNLQDTPATKTKKVYVKNVLCMYCNTPGKSNHPEWRKCSKAKCNQMHCCGSDACVKHFQEHCNACTKK